jgi:acyl transferase domain-containing protein/acyl carrier protein
MTERRQILQEALAAIERLQGQVKASEGARHEPIAIVGVGCRFPGPADDLDALWTLLRDGVDAVAPVPRERWDWAVNLGPNPTPDRSPRAGMVPRLDQFEPQMFGISPREAVLLDPQQRLLLETSHEALESAGLAPDRLIGSPTGVFVGLTAIDFRSLLQFDDGKADVYVATGTSLNAAAGRISFTYGLQGPCVALDTACSSSLVAVHLACQSLRARESDVALAGGVNVILMPQAIALMVQWGMLAPDGKCKSFDASADGFVRAEGCAMIAMKRLADAQAAKDPILAVIRGSAVNSDGRSSGLTVPSGPAQEAVVRSALADAQLSPDDVDYVETHGTGTSLGDPIEVEALGAVMAGRPPERPVRIGSIKTNIGHCESASGVAGLLKVILAFQREAIPGNLHFQNPNPRIRWGDFPVEVATGLTPWPRGERVRRAGVSSFGLAGTNAHVILEEPPPVEGAAAAEAPVAVPLSAREDHALRDAARRTADALARDPRLSLADVAHTLGAGRAALPRRVAIVAGTRAELERDLRAFAAGQAPASAVEGTLRPGERPKIAFLFTGQGAQYPGMGRGLYEREPVFREAIDRAAAILAPKLPRPLLEVLFPPPGTPTPLSETGYTQPALFALEYALAEQWRAWGITPSVVLGHSVGEYAAACVAGVMTLEEGLGLIAERGRLMQALPAGGAMAAVFAAEDQVARRIAPLAGRVSIAAQNGPEETVVSGDADAVAEVVAAFAAEGVNARPLEVSHAFHSHRLDPMLEPLAARAAGIAAAPPRILLVSNLTGAPFAPGAAPDAGYWRRHAREPVRFLASIQALRQLGVNVLLEIGPHPTLVALAARAAPDATWASVASLRRGKDDAREAASAVAALYARGAPVAWDAVSRGRGRRVPLPTYPFQRARYWPEIKPQKAPSVAPGGHPLLGRRQPSPRPGAEFLAEIGRDAPAFLAEHAVLGTVPFPATGYVEMALAAAGATGPGPVALERFSIEAPLALEAGARVLLHVAVEPQAGGRAEVVVRSTPAAEPGTWKVHARTALRRAPAPAEDAPEFSAARERCGKALDAGEYYQRLVRAGVEYGPTFRALRTLQVGRDAAFGLIEVSGAGDGPGPFVLHPALLDAAIHVVGAALVETLPAGTPDPVFMPLGIEEVRVVAAVPPRVRATAVVRPGSAGSALLVADLRLDDEAGNAVALVRGVQLRLATRAALERALAVPGIRTHAYTLRWTPLDDLDRTQAPKVEGRVVLVADRGGFAAALADALASAGARCELLPQGDVEALDPDGLAARLRGDGTAPLAWVVHCAPLDAGVEDVAAGAAAQSMRLLRLSQAVAAASPSAGLCLVTRGAHAAAPGEAPRLAQAPLLGLARSVAAERGEAPALRIDLDPAAPPDVRPVLLALGGLHATEPELAVRSGALVAPRLDEAGRDEVRAVRDPSMRQVLRLGERGSLEALRLETEPRTAPGKGQVEIAVRAAGLNFRDVLNALGMVPGATGVLGSECAGVVTAVGEGVAGLAVGDEVVACAMDSLATHTLAPASLVLPKPPGVGFADATSVPMTYLTAAEALVTVARIAPGQKVLIHAAAGGVGLAALRLARRAGAVVIATAGSPEKRALALAHGAAHAFDSRSASFADDVLGVTGGAGVDCVLNSLSGDLIAAGMRVVRPGGVFVEIGKKGIWTPEEAAKRAPAVRYEIVDLGDAMIRDVARIRGLLAGILRDLASGELEPLPVRTYALADAAAAFRTMAAGRHVGKLALVPPDDGGPRALPVRADGTYLVTGGLGGLGLVVAERLAARGAGALVLVGRRAPDADQAARLEKLRSGGTKVVAAACDVADRDAVRRLWREVLAPLPPLRGIVHSAGVNSDAPLAAQDEARLRAVASAKIDGTLNLHEQVGRAPLDFFALFSSTAALLGSPGQVNYSAANSFLDGLAAFRRAQGLAATSVGWGAWAEFGMAARLSESYRSRWARMGMGLLDRDGSLDELEHALAGAAPYVAVISLNSTQVGAQGAPAVRALLGARTAAAAPAAGDAATPAPAADPLASVKAAARASPEERLAVLRPYVHGQVARVLGFDASALDVDMPLSSLGFDSLMAVQLRNKVQADLGVEVPLAQFLTGPTVAELGAVIAARLGGSGEGTATVGPAAPAAPTQAPGAGSWEEGSI